jgi:50S ribosomal protein L16 3-hydroxylase
MISYGPCDGAKAAARPERTIQRMPIDLKKPMPLLGGATPAAFMRDTWQKRPLLIRQALPGVVPPVTPKELFALAERDDVESRLVIHGDEAGARRGRQGRDAAWQLRHGPLPRRALPPLKQREWTLLVQGVDLHVEAAHELLQRFRWTPDARVDDLMISFATDGGGVGAHVDSYDVFLLQVHGRRRWRVGPVEDPSFRPGLPVRLLEHFEPTEEWLLEPGDMLYVPPRWGHDGVAEGECMTCSIGYRTPMGTELAKELLLRLLDDVEAPDDEPHFRDPPRSATAAPGRMPPALARFAHRAVDRLLRDRTTLDRALGEVMSEPKPRVWFDEGAEWDEGQGVRLDRRTRMMYDDRHVFINGESFRASGRDARLMRVLADERRLSARESSRLSGAAREVVADWIGQGWARAIDEAGADRPPAARITRRETVNDDDAD